MNLEQYQPLARRTMKELPLPKHIEHMAVGINGELGEIADAIKKHTIYGKELDMVNLHEEGGDAWWYIAGLQPELRGDFAAMQRAFDGGFHEGSGFNSWSARSLIYTVTFVQRELSLNTYALLVLGDVIPKNTGAHYLNALCHSMGLLYGRLGLDLSSSLVANIEKLSKRYGDKYSDFAALNRDTAAERGVLEANLPGAAA